jgi:hypothetical protein
VKKHENVNHQHMLLLESAAACVGDSLSGGITVVNSIVVVLAPHIPCCPC